MEGEGYPCPTLSIKSLLVLLALQLANVQNVNGNVVARVSPGQIITDPTYTLVTPSRIYEVSSIVNITECSVQHLAFTLTEKLNINSEYSFLAACKDSGACVDGKVQLGNAVEPTVGSTFQVSVGPSCTLGEELSPSEPGLCTLLISSSDAFRDTTGIVSTVCTLPTSSSRVSTMSVQTTSTSASAGGKPTNQSPPVHEPNLTGPLSTPVIVAIIAIPLFLVIVVLIVALISLLVWKRHSQIRPKTQRTDVPSVRDKWNALLGSRVAATAKDNHTVHDSIFHDEEELDRQ